MKFARHLKDNQIPEWQKAYIDYRGLKKLIAEVRNAEALSSASTTVGDVSSQPSCAFTAPRVGVDERTRDWHDVIDISARAAARLRGANDRGSMASTTSMANDVPRATKTMSHIRHSMFSLSPGLTRRRTRGLSLASIWSEMPWKANPLAGLSLSELYKELNPLQMQFFTVLDAELDKVNSFYAMKESELQDRTQLLIEQFKELNEHRRMVYRAQPSKTPIWRLAWNRTLRSMPAILTSDEAAIGERFSRASPSV
ncbi:SPX domain-containing protein [Amanita rubescens]|nr:SPX domain-containing protein [Amanita rubescens]